MPNMLRFQFALGGQRWSIVGCYLVSYNVVTIKHIIATIIQRHLRAALLVAGEFNTDLAAPKESISREEITAAVEAAGLEDMSILFLPRHTYWAPDGRTWCICF